MNDIHPKQIFGSSRPPSAADKYRLYKKLSKLGNATRSHPEISHPPSTPPPPRSTELPISIVPRSRAVKTETACVSNPFSPAKNKQKRVAPSSISGCDLVAFPSLESFL